MRVAVLSSALPEVRCAGHDVHLIQECRGDKPLAYVQVWFQKQISHESDARRKLPRVSDCVADLRVCLLELGIADLPFSDVLLEGDVLQVTGNPVDAVLATNFSYYLFKTRSELKNYFMTARKHIRPGGIFIMDAYGGSESFEEQEEERDLDGFVYVWDQNHYNPITGDVINHIHFRFPDGTEMNKAFTYEWRLWTLPELQELLLEAGFQSVNVYWEGTIEDGAEAGEGDGEFKQTRVGEACQGWIAYLVAQP